MRKRMLILAFVLLGFGLADSSYAQKTITSANKQQTAATDSKPRKRRAERYDTGSFFGFSVGAGVGDLGYSLNGGTHSPLPSATLGFDYLYYFTKNIGVSTGLSVSYYGSVARLHDHLAFPSLKDAEGEEYTHIIEFDRWREQQHVFMAEVPILFQYKHKPWQKGFFASAGVKLGLPLSSTYKWSGGGVQNSAYYPLWNLSLHDLPDRFEYAASVKQSDRMAGLTHFDVFGYAEVGGLWQIDKRIDFRLSAYASYCFNNIDRQRRIDKQDLGFANYGNDALAYMNRYEGLLATNKAGNIHPWTVGLKVGITLYSGLTEQQKRKRVKQFMKDYQDYIHTDTIFVHDTIFLSTTIESPQQICVETHVNASPSPSSPTDTIISQLDSLLSEAVIWFRFDEFDPILEPADILDAVAQACLNNPNLRLHVNGHACDIGTDAYNLQLALHRAQAVARLLRAKGVKDEQLDIRSFGSQVPFHYTGEHQRSKDRRVEIIPYR